MLMSGCAAGPHNNRRQMTLCLSAKGLISWPAHRSQQTRTARVTTGSRNRHMHRPNIHPPRSSLGHNTPFSLTAHSLTILGAIAHQTQPRPRKSNAVKRIAHVQFTGTTRTACSCLYAEHLPPTRSIKTPRDHRSTGHALMPD
jgi:hypothetical protein